MIQFKLKNKTEFSLIISAMLVACVVLNASQFFNDGVLPYLCIALVISLAITSVYRSIYDGVAERMSIVLIGLIPIVKILISPISFDDWSYIGASMDGLLISNIFYPINGHQIPFFQLFIYFLDKYLPLHHVVFQMSLVGVNIFVFSAILRFCTYFNYNKKIINVILFCWVLFPTLNDARVWFGGGFWLAFSVGIFLYFIPFFDGLLKKETFKFSDFGLFLLYISTMAGASSSYKFVFINVLPVIFFHKIKNTKNKYENFYIIFLIIAGLLLSRAMLKTMGFNPFYYNQDVNMFWYEAPYLFIRNLGYWVNAQIGGVLFFDGNIYRAAWSPLPLFINAWGWVNIIIGMLFLSIIIFSLWILRRGKYFYPMVILCFNFFLYILQIEIARGWDYNRLITGYYQYLLVTFGILIILPLVFLIRKPAYNKFGFYWLLFFGLYTYTPRVHDLNRSVEQQIFLQDLGRAYCSLAKQSNEPRFLPPLPNLDDCKKCTKILNGPEVYVQSLFRTDDYFYKLIKKVVANECPLEYERFLWHKYQNPKGDLSMKYDENGKDWLAFKRNYFSNVVN